MGLRSFPIKDLANLKLLLFICLALLTYPLESLWTQHLVAGGHQMDRYSFLRTPKFSHCTMWFSNSLEVWRLKSGVFCNLGSRSHWMRSVYWGWRYCIGHIQTASSPGWDKLEPIHWRSRGARADGPGKTTLWTIVRQKRLTRLNLYCNATSPGKALLWPVKYMKTHIPGGLLCDVDRVFLLITLQSLQRKIKLCSVLVSDKPLNTLSVIQTWFLGWY